jgi:nucleoside-diphosphate-sugar epimerase
LSFTPEILADAIKKEMPDFSIDYNPDFRQAIAETWPASIDDSFAREHWGWKHHYDLNDIVKDMLKNLRTKLNIK